MRHVNYIVINDISDKEDVAGSSLCIMNSKTTVMLYNPHLHLYTGDQQEARNVRGGTEEECTYVCNGSSHLQYVIA